MSAYRLLSTLCVLPAISLVPAGPTQAQQPLPAACTSADRELYSASTDRAVGALQAGDLERFVELSTSLDAGVSEACRRALAPRNPARQRCSSNEKATALMGFSAIARAVVSGDFPTFFQVAERLEGSLSRDCWIAVNRHQDPRVVRDCTSAELDVMASYAGPAIRATRSMLDNGDFMAPLRIVQQMQSRLSPRCNAAVAAHQQRQQRQQAHTPKSSAGPSMPGNVIDHGNGTLSMPGVGACTPSECMAF